jgi:hypothetical protein
MNEFGHRNAIYNAHKLFMGDKLDDCLAAGAWAERLLFTSEGAEECARVAESYLGLTDYVPNGMTRGLYYRGVE